MLLLYSLYIFLAQTKTLVSQWSPRNSCGSAICFILINHQFWNRNTKEIFLLSSGWLRSRVVRSSQRLEWVTLYKESIKWITSQPSPCFAQCYVWIHALIVAQCSIADVALWRLMLHATAGTAAMAAVAPSWVVFISSQFLERLVLQYCWWYCSQKRFNNGI